MERTLYLWTGLVIAGFFGSFAIWVRESDPTHRGLFWACVAGAATGATLLLVWVIATGVALAIRETAAERDPR